MNAGSDSDFFLNVPARLSSSIFRTLARISSSPLSSRSSSASSPFQARLPPHLRAYCETPSGSSASDGSFTAVPETPHLIAVFSVHLDDVNPSSEEVRKLVEWLQALNPSIGLELTGIHRSRSTVLVMVLERRGSGMELG
jgi:hypothetical protein